MNTETIKTDTRSDYEIQADTFLEKCNARIEWAFDGLKPYFPGDKESRLCYTFKIIRGDRHYTKTFGSSLVDLYNLLDLKPDYSPRNRTKIELEERLSTTKFNLAENTCRFSYTPKDKAFPKKVIKPIPFPTSYDLLSCLQKYELEDDINDFADNHEYTIRTDTNTKFSDVHEQYTNIIQAYKDLNDEYKGLCMLFTSEEMRELQEIQ